MAKKDNNFRYPKYSDGKILTCGDLNNSFDFLHTQVKSTRNLLFGQGIVHGLSYNYNKDSGEITIHQGIAITKSGSIIEIKEVGKYKFYAEPKYLGYKENEEEKIDFILLENKVDENDTNIKEIRDIGKIDDYLLGLKVYYTETKDEYCTDKSCQLQSDEVIIEIVPFLTNIKESNAEDETPVSKQYIDEYYRPKLTKIIYSNELSIFIRTIKNYYDDNVKRINEAIEEINEKFIAKKPLGSNTPKEKIKKLQKELDNKNIGAYLSFIYDLYDSINEFTAHFNDYTSKYQVQYSEWYSDAIILGGNLTANSLDSSHRYNLIQTYQDFGKNKDERILIRLFNRIHFIIEYFKPDIKSEATDIKLLPSSKNKKLGEQVMPIYFDANLKQHWDAHNEYHIENMPTYNDFKNEKYLNHMQSLDLFQINGYAGLKSNVVYSSLDKIITKYNLPLIVKEFDLVGDTISFDLENYYENISGNNNYIKKFLDILFNKIIEPNKKLSDSINKNVKNCVEVIVNQYFKINYKIKNFTEIRNINRECDFEEIRQAIYLIIKDGDLNTFKTEEKQAALYLYEFINRAILYARLDGKEIKNTDKPGVNYIGGVGENNILLLVKHENQLLLCLDMSYLNLLNTIKGSSLNYLNTSTPSKGLDMKYEVLPKYFFDEEIDLNNSSIDSTEQDDNSPTQEITSEQSTDENTEETTEETNEEVVEETIEEIPVVENKKVFSVYLEKVGRSTAKVPNLIAEIKGINVDEVKELIKSLPFLIKDKIKNEEAENIKAQLEEAGATVIIKKTEQDENSSMLEPPQNSENEVIANELYSVVLKNAGSSKLTIVKLIIDITKHGIIPIRDLVDAAPSIIIKGVTKDVAENIKKQLEEAGATAAIINKDSEFQDILNEFYSVVLKNAGSSKPTIVKLINDITKHGIRPISDLVDAAPSIIIKGVTKDVAENIKKQLEEAGATATIINKDSEFQDILNEFYSVVLKNAGSSKPTIVKLINDITKHGIRPISDLVDAAPSIIIKGVTKDVAENIKKQLEEAGATATIINKDSEFQDILNEFYSVVLKNAGSSKPTIVKLVKGITKLGLKEAKDLVDAAPSEIIKGVTEDVAENIKKQLEEAGATVIIKNTEQDENLSMLEPPQNSENEVIDNEFYSVILNNAGNSKVAIVKLVREITKLGLKEAKDLVDAAPSEIIKDVTEDVAENIKKQLEEAGATATIKNTEQDENLSYPKPTPEPIPKPTPKPIQDDTPTFYKINLTSYGKSKTKTISLLQATLKISKKQAQDYVNKIPQIISSNINLQEAERICEKLKKAQLQYELIEQSK